MISAYHSIHQESLARCLEIGLKYGEAGARSKEPLVQQANEYLDRHITEQLEPLGLYRQQCLYMYAGFGNLVLDIKTGELTAWQDWDAGEEFRKLRVMLEEGASYVSDLDAYDALTRALQDDTAPETQRSLAAEYWNRIVPLTTFLQNYSIVDSRLAYTSGPGNGPTGYRRIEIMVTQDIPPSRIEAL